MSEKKTQGKREGVYSRQVLVRDKPPSKKEVLFTKRVFYRDKKLVADRPGYEVEEILANHVLPGDDYNPTGQTARAAAVAVRAMSEKTRDGRKKGGDHKRGKYGAMRSMVNILKPRSLNDLLSMLQDEDQAEDLPENRSLIALGYRIRIHDVNRDEEVLYYSLNDTDAQIEFRALRNYISAAKKAPFIGC